MKEKFQNSFYANNFPKKNMKRKIEFEDKLIIRKKKGKVERCAERNWGGDMTSMFYFL